MNFKTPNSFVQCRCGRDWAIRYLNEERNCTCGRRVKFSKKVKLYLISRHIEHKPDSDINIEGLIVKPIEYIRIKD